MKRFYLAATLVAMMTFSGANYANSEHYQQEQDDIRQMFTSYMAKYNGYLSQGVLSSPNDLYLDEFIIMSNSRPARTMTPADFMQQAKEFLGSLKQRGVAKVDWESVNITLLDDNLALASNVALRLKQDGSLYNRVGATYLLKRNDQGWRIAAFAVHDANKSVTSLN